MLITALVLCASGVADSGIAGDCPAFDSKSSGLFAPISPRHEVGRIHRSQGGSDGGVAGASCAPAVTGLENPGPVWRHGNLLYVGNNEENTTKTVTVVDVTTPGAEFVVETISTPVDPVDVAVAIDRLYVIDSKRDQLWSQPLGGGAWTSIALPNGVIQEWDYGHIIEPLGDRMYVIHQWENKIDVVDLVAGVVESTITDIDHLPDRIVFTGNTMVVLGVGLDAPSCGANGPNFSVYSLPSHAKLYRKSIAGNCPLELLAQDGHVWVFFNNQVRRYDLATGNFINQLVIAGIAANAVHRGADIIGQKFGGEMVTIDPALGGFATLCDLVGSQIWFPPLEQMAWMGLADGRVFVTNRNNDTLDRVWLDPICAADLDGNGAVDGGDLGILLGQWGGPGSADFDGNGTVDGADLGVMLGAWGACA